MLQTFRRVGLKTALILLSSLAVMAGGIIANPAFAANYELLLFARKRNNPWITTNDTGHAWLSVIKNDGRGWYVDQTFGFWPWGIGLRVNQGSDRNHTERYLRGDFGFAPRGLAVRKMRLSSSQANTVKGTLGKNPFAFSLSSCYIYSPTSVLGAKSCNCIDFSARAWTKITGDWRVSLPLNITPDQFVDRINWANRQTGDFVK